MAKILITGGSGFVGSNLIDYLETKHSIVKFDRTKKEIDLREIEVIIHLAGLTEGNLKMKKLNDFVSANFDLTKTLFDEFTKSNGTKFIFISSVKACAESSDEIITEETTPNPETYYGISKLKAEDYLMSNNYIKGKRVYILRPPLIYGPGNLGNLSLLYKFIKLGIPWPFGKFNNKRSFCSIDNLNFVINEFINRNDIESGIYNVADDDAISTTELVSLIYSKKSGKPRVLNIPPKMVALFATIGDILRLPLNSNFLSKMTESLIVSNKKIKNNLGIELPTKIQFGLNNFFQSIKA